MATKSTGSDKYTPDQLPPKALSEFTNHENPPGIEVVTDTARMMDTVKLEKFMHETVIIRLFDDAREGTLPIEIPSVNGVNQPIVRGVPTPVKRKYVEALARAKRTDYTMKQDRSEPDKIEYIPKTTQQLPFEVIEDTNEGRRWLIELLKQPA